MKQRGRGKLGVLASDENGRLEREWNGALLDLR